MMKYVFTLYPSSIFIDPQVSLIAFLKFTSSGVPQEIMSKSIGYWQKSLDIKLIVFSSGRVYSFVSFGNP